MTREIAIHQIDAFTSELFAGNPAAVCPLDEWLDVETMQAIAAENNLSETAFYVPRDGYCELRWFTPVVEIDLCGHATLAAASVIFGENAKAGDEIVFRSQRSGELRVSRTNGNRYALNFPALPPQRCELSDELNDALGVEPRELLAADRYLAVLDSEATVRTLKPKMHLLARLGRSVIVTAPGTDVDFVSRFFAPAKGVAEDPVTGSAHCVLIPFWSKRLGRQALHAHQVSARGGELFCRDLGDRVEISGTAVRYMSGTVYLP